MTHFYFIILVFYFLLSVNLDSYSQSLYKYEFRIFKDGKLVTDISRNVRVEAGKYNLNSQKYVRFSDTCADPGKYCFTGLFDCREESNEKLLLKIFTKKDSMIIYTNVSLDSLVYKPGEYFFDQSIASYFNTVPAKGVSIKLVSDLVKLKRKRSHHWSINKPSFFTSLQQALNEYEDLKIDPNDSSIIVTKNYNSILSTKDPGAHWMKIEPKFKDKIRNICFTDDGDKYLIIKRGDHSFKSDFNTYFKSETLMDSIVDKGWDHFECPESNTVHQFAFKLKDKSVDDDYPTDEYLQYDCNSCPVTYRDKGNPVFHIKRNVKFWNTAFQKMEYVNPEYPLLYEFNHQKILLLDHCFLYSEDGKHWKYYPFSDFDEYRPFEYDRWLHSTEVSYFYWLEGKGVLFRYRDVGLFLIDVYH
ncbi:MAG: hypothetical protein NVV82_26395 [Sporocytophaga sp.]|nr:hypothetical protein [Sporocytophaga sp.]